MPKQKLTARTSRVRKSNVLAALVAELLFTFLPFILIFVLLAYKNSLSNIIYSSEWSLAASIVSGQTIVKFIISLLEYKADLNLGWVALITTGLIVFLLAPSLIVLAIMHLSPTPSFSFGVLQVILFGLSVVAYLYYGKVSK